MGNETKGRRFNQKLKPHIILQYLLKNTDENNDFDPDPEIFTDWCKKLKDDVKTQVMLCGHFHATRIYEVGGDIDQKGQPCTVVVGSRDVLDENRKRVSFVGGAYTIDGDKMKVEFTNSQHEVLEEHIVDLNV